MLVHEIVFYEHQQRAIKSQVLADFIIDWTEPSNYKEGLVIDTPWQVNCDTAWETPEPE
jgi:hypothetical protein